MMMMVMMMMMMMMMMVMIMMMIGQVDRYIGYLFRTSYRTI